MNDCADANRQPSALGVKMLRLSRADVIHDLALLIDDTASRIGQHEWSIRGVDCRRERHSHSAAAYSFDLDVLNLRARGGEQGAWELFIVTEYWRSGRGMSLHNPKWLKLVQGKPTDVLRWIKLHRAEALDKFRAASTKSQA